MSAHFRVAQPSPEDEQSAIGQRGVEVRSGMLASTRARAGILVCSFVNRVRAQRPMISRYCTPFHYFGNLRKTIKLSCTFGDWAAPTTPPSECLRRQHCWKFAPRYSRNTFLDGQFGVLLVACYFIKVFDCSSIIYEEGIKKAEYEELSSSSHSAYDLHRKANAKVNCLSLLAPRTLKN
jgi:hypothetical protein